MYRYQKEGKRLSLTLGTFPQVGLKEAREARDIFKMKLRTGKTTATPKNKFEYVVNKFISVKFQSATPKYLSEIKYKFEKYLMPPFKDRDIASIKSQEIADVLTNLSQQKNDRGTNTIELSRRCADLLTGRKSSKILSKSF